MTRVISSLIIAGTVLGASMVFSAEIPEFAKVCSGCHTFEKGGAKKTGPDLFGVYGREATIAGGGWKWDDETLDKFLEDPVAGVKALSGREDATSKMTIPKIKDKEKRKAIIEFLKSLKD